MCISWTIKCLISLLFICMLYHPSAHRVGNWINESPSERVEIYRNVKTEASMEYITPNINHHTAIPSTPVLTIG